MDSSFFILLAISAVLLAVALGQGGAPLAAAGLRTGLDLLARVAPQVVIAFALAGLVTVLLPSDVLGRLVGGDSGMMGLVIATAAGLATPGGPFVQFPLVAAIAKAGAGPGPMAAYITAWSLLGWNRIVVYELPLLGPAFTLARVVASLILPVAVGLIVPPVLRMITR